MKNNAAILVIDDETEMQRLLEITLESHDYKVSTASSGKEGLYKASHRPPELILLDLGLPDESGHAVLAKLRKWYTGPVIIVSVQNKEEDIVFALDQGANDYLVKPFRTLELLARIRAALRSSSPEEKMHLIRFGDLDVDIEKRIVRKNGKPLKLTSIEYTLLILLVRNEGRVLTHQYLLREVWGPGYTGQTQYLRVYIAQLRKKIEEDPNNPHLIFTESGVGYRFAQSDDE